MAMTNKSNTIRTVLADDEPAALASMEILLSKRQDVEVIARCKDGKEAAEAIMTLQPDLVFLDIQMPEMNGFEVLEIIKEDFIPAIVFVTAFDHYALKAFEKSVVDYLLKPYDDERFYASLDKAKEIIAARKIESQIQRLEMLLRNFQKQGYLKKLTIKNNGRITFVPVESILSIESEGNFVKVHAQTGIKLANYTFKQLLEILDPKLFVRIHKSHIVNIDWIEMIETHFHGDYHIILKDGSALKLSRNYKESLDRILGQSY
jgi:two-component system LytT family response regulator